MHRARRGSSRLMLIFDEDASLLALDIRRRIIDVNGSRPTISRFGIFAQTHCNRHATKQALQFMTKGFASHGIEKEIDLEMREIS